MLQEVGFCDNKKAIESSKNDKGGMPAVSHNIINAEQIEEKKKAVHYEGDEYDEDDYEEDEQKQVVGNVHTVQAAKSALKNSTKTLIKVEGILNYEII
jgi:glutamine synthetase type III